jgi:prolyl oligopeptidase
MRRVLVLLGAALMLGAARSGEEKLVYPPAPRSAQVDVYHGVKVADPYRPLEELDAPATHAWIAAERELTRGYIGAIPQRAEIAARLRGLWNYERRGVPVSRGDRYFYLANGGLQAQDVLYVASSPGGPGRVLIDPNEFSKDGTVALRAWSPDHAGKLLAYSVSDAGSDWQTWHVRDVASGRDLPDAVAWSKFSDASWLRDGSGFFYARYDVPAPGDLLKAANENQKIYLHRVGTAQAADELVYERPEHKDWTFEPLVSDDGEALFILAGSSDEIGNRVFYRDLRKPGARFETIVAQAGKAWSPVDKRGARVWFFTNDGAPRGRIVALDLDRPHEPPVAVIAEQKAAIESASIVAGRIVLRLLDGPLSAVKIYDLDGAFARDVRLPGIGTAEGFGGMRDDTETFFAFRSYTAPSSIYRLDPRTGAIALVFAPNTAVDSSRYVSEEVFYTSKDGTRIPMIVTARKDTPRDGTAPAVLYGYGGFNIAITPGFSVPWLVWLDLGGVLAVPNIRGGSEYGEAWHDGGRLARKQNVFDDFIAAADYLVAHGYTSHAKLALEGGSNGGLLVGAVMTQRPDICGAALPKVGVLDMLRFQKFTIGAAWISDYGSSDDPALFETLHAYSPLHNLRMGTHYPATLVFTADHDDRVFPAHSFKFAAALQAAQGGEAPVLISIEERAGHGAGKPVEKQINEAADDYAFLYHVLGMTSLGSP